MGDRILPKEICSILNPEEGTSSVSAVPVLLAALTLSRVHLQKQEGSATYKHVRWAGKCMAACGRVSRNAY